MLQAYFFVALWSSYLHIFFNIGGLSKFEKVLNSAKFYLYKNDFSKIKVNGYRSNYSLLFYRKLNSEVLGRFCEKL